MTSDPIFSTICQTTQMRPPAFFYQTCGDRDNKNI